MNNRQKSNEMTSSTDNLSSSIESLSDSNQFIKHQQIINENTQLKDEIINLKKILELQKQTENDYNEQIHTLQLRIEELEDWNGNTFEIQNKVINIL